MRRAIPIALILLSLPAMALAIGDLLLDTPYPTFVPDTVSPGGEFEVTGLRITNNFHMGLGYECRIGVYLWDPATPSLPGLLLATSPFSAYLPAGSTFNYGPIPVTLPGATPHWDQIILVWIDDLNEVAELNEDNNRYSGLLNVVYNPEMTIVKTGPGSVAIGDDITYTITVTNTGDLTLSNISVSDPTTSACNNVFASLAPGTSESYTCTWGPVTEADLPGPIINTATADSDQTNPVSDSHSVNIVTSPSLDIVKDGPNSVTVGEIITYNITVLNTGDVTLHNVTVNDFTATSCDNVFASLTPGARESYICTYQTSQADLPGPLVNTVMATSDEGEEASDTHSVVLDAPLIPFDDIGAGLEGVGDGKVAWGDYDNDGDLDILLSGEGDDDLPHSLVYRNDYGIFTDIGAGLLDVEFSTVAWGDYDNDGDLDILLTGSADGPSSVSLVYRNDSGSFTDIGAGLKGVILSSVAWGDYDNDGDLDILLSGLDDDEFFSHSLVYRNDNGNFVDIGAGLTRLYLSSAAWGDYDNDGDLDILLSGEDEDSLPHSLVYRNDNGTFTDLEAGLLNVGHSSVAWGDYDNDGDLDILLAGVDAYIDKDHDPYSLVYRNDSGVFTDIGAGLVGVRGRSSVAWGDYDNDGDLDILLVGDTDSEYVSWIYRNDSGNFTDIEAGLEGVAFGSVAWGDYDNDGDLDILLAGDSGSAKISRVYRNDITFPNTSPTAPSNLSYSDRVLSWEAASDAQTSALGLTYNLRIGTTPGAGNICSGMANEATGYRDVAQWGNAGHNLSWPMGNQFDHGVNYYCSIQAIDGAFAGSPFSTELMFQYQEPSAVEGPDVPSPYALGDAIPNPFNPQTTIWYELPREALVRFTIFDAKGRVVKTLIGHDLSGPGKHHVVWKGKDDSGHQVATGVYFYRLEAGSYCETKKMTLVK